MSVINEKDIPGLAEERLMLAWLTKFFLAGNSVKRLPDGSFKVDPTTFMVVIPGPAKGVSPYKDGTALFQKEWAGAVWVCDWFGLEEEGKNE